MSSPYFSIIMPVYNRAGLVPRAIRSCLSQTFGDFEIVVVDDASTDGSVEVVRSFTDTRIRLLIHDRNMGRCPARNTGMAAARGQWFVFLDSDDELLPEALATIRQDAEHVGSNVASLRYSCIDPEGNVSPDPPHPRSVWTYHAYLRSLEAGIGGLTESLPCARTSTFPAIAYPDGHAEEGLYHLDLALRHDVAVFPSVLRLYHQDAPNQITRPSMRRALRLAPDNAGNVDAVLARHGAALAVHAPAVHALRLREGALYHFMARDRRRGLEYALRHVQHAGLSFKTALIVIFGLLGRRPLAFVQAFQAAVRRLR
jgi:glycosyltransferase involved in cell wall biosynthesis